MKEQKKELKLSVCMILKNEGSTIYRCLDSMKSFVDEWIIGIDESTDDNTFKEVRKFLVDNDMDADGETIWKSKLTNKVGVVYSYKWKNNFSKARNEGMDKATGDYILIMDGHEYIPKSWFNLTLQQDIPCIEVMNGTKKILSEDKPDEMYLNLYQQPFTGNIPNNFFLQPRIYRNDPKIRFGRAAHNTIKNTDKDKSIHMIESIIIHDAPSDNRVDRKKQRMKMNVDELDSMIKKDPKDTRAMFYLGNTFMESGEWKKAINSFNNYLKKRKDDNSEKYQVLIHKALCHKELDEDKESRSTLYKAIELDPIYRRDAHMLLGDLYYKLKDYEKAINCYETTLRIRPNASRMFQNGGAMTWDPHQKLAMVYANIGNIPKSILHLESAIKFWPRPEWVAQTKEWRSADKKKLLIIDRGGSFTKDFIKHLESRYQLVVTKQFDLTLANWADYIWAEWANDDAVLCSQKFPQKTVVRLHGWEAYGLSHLWPQMKWDALKKVVFVCDHIKKRMSEKLKNTFDNWTVIYNGVDTDKFFIKEWKRNPKSVGYAGYMNTKKNPWLLIQTIKNNPDYTFHLRIEHQDPFWESTFKYELEDCKNVVYHGRYDNLEEFWNQVGCVISTSMIESFSYNVAEAMSCGCRPYVYNWLGAKDLWRKKDIFKSQVKLSDKELTEDEMKKNRQYILDKYPLQSSLEQMEEVLVK